MKRYVKVNNQWIDTLEDQKQWGRYYYEIEDILYYLWDETMLEYKQGKIQDQTDNLY